MLFCTFHLMLLIFGSVDEVKLVDLTCSKKGEMVLATLVVDSIELSQTAVGTDDVRVAKEAPDLTQGHGERLFALGSLDLLSVELVPVLEIRVVSQQDILALLFNFGRVLLEINQILDVDQLAEGVLLDLFQSLLGSARLR